MPYRHLTADLGDLQAPAVRERLAQAKAAASELLAMEDLPEGRRAELERAHEAVSATLLAAARNAVANLTTAVTAALEPVEVAEAWVSPPGAPLDECVAVLNDLMTEPAAPARAMRPVPAMKRIPRPVAIEPEPVAPVRDPRPVPVAYASSATGDPADLRPWDPDDDAIPY